MSDPSSDIAPAAAGAPPSSKVPLSVRIGFGVGDFGFLLVWQGTALFLYYFYTDILGIDPFIAGLIYFVAMAWDAVTDPLIATLADRTRTSMGKYRPWLLYGAVPFGACYPLAFSVPPEGWPLGVIAWALITHILLRTTYTVVSMPFSSLQARLTSDSQERAVLAGFRMAGAATGGLVVVFITPVFLTVYGEGRAAEAFFMAACLAGTATILSLLYCFMTMREPEIDTQEPTTSIFEDLKSIGPIFVNNPPLIRVFSIIIIATVCMGMFGKNMLYYFQYDLERPDLAVFGLTLPAFLLILGVPFWVWLAGKTSKKTSMSWGAAVALVGYLGFILNPTDNFAIIISTIGLTGLGAAAIAVMYWSMLPDTVEYGEAKTGIRAEAKTFGFASFAQKSAVGINAVLLGALLSAVGFEANAEQSDVTLLGIKLIMAGIPALGAIMIILILRDYRLDRQAHTQLLQDIAR
ncbi:MAG: glycoside-pentoside-hexuronide (GPH):cation symporter [Pseudomonadota bacterium]